MSKTTHAATLISEWEAMTEEQRWEKFLTVEEALAAAQEDKRYGWETAKASDSAMRRVVAERNEIAAERDRLLEVVSGETHLGSLSAEYCRQATAAANRAEACAAELVDLLRRLQRVTGDSIRCVIQEKITKYETRHHHEQQLAS